MLSPFLKKLLFARQFDMAEGKIEMLGQKEVMLPASVLGDLHKIDTKRSYQILKEGVRKAMEDDAKRIGMEGEGALKIAQEIFCMYGLGKPEIIVLDNHMKKSVVRIHKPAADRDVVGAALAGMFSVVFGRDVDCKVTQDAPTLMEFELH